MARPGGNITGFSASFDPLVAGKWLEMLTQITPPVARVAVFLFVIFLFGTELFFAANVGETTFSQSGAMMDTIRSDTATVVESGQSATSRLSPAELPQPR